MTKLSIFALLLVLISCSDDTKLSAEPEKDELATLFQKFPESPFLNMEFQEPIMHTNEKK